MCVSPEGVWWVYIGPPDTHDLIWEKPGRKASAGLGSAWTYSWGEVITEWRKSPPFPAWGRGRGGWPSSEVAIDQYSGLQTFVTAQSWAKTNPAMRLQLL